MREHYWEQHQCGIKRLARLCRGAEQPDLAVPLIKELIQDEQTLEDLGRDVYAECRDRIGRSDIVGQEMRGIAESRK